MRTPFVLVAALLLGSTHNTAQGLGIPEQSAPSTEAPQPRDHEHGAKGGPEVKQPTMAEMRHQMMAHMNATDADLNRLVTTMNTATGAAKTAVMAELLTRLVQRQTAMRAQMDESMKTMMARCSMMKESGALDEKPKH
jgi:hypothetical protein